MTYSNKSLLSDIPAKVLNAARFVATDSGETLVGYKAVTAPVPGEQRVVPIRWQVFTNAGIYEYTPEGDCVRAGVLHPFPDPTPADQRRFDCESEAYSLSDCVWWDWPLSEMPVNVRFECAGPRVGQAGIAPDNVVLCEAHYNS